MTIETVRKRGPDNERGDFLVQCDGKGCKAHLEAKDRTWQQLMTYMDAMGWCKHKVFSTWLHKCSACSGAVPIKDLAKPRIVK
jgi:hypothetical protein